ELAGMPVRWVEQASQLGTGHAVAQALPEIPADDFVLVLYGDVPLIGPETLQALVTAAEGSGFSLLTAKLPDPAGYGRIVRDDSGKVLRIVEHKDAGDTECAINEINTGMLVVRADWLQRWVASLDSENKQGEYYLTDIIGMATAEGVTINAIQPATVFETQGVNDRVQLAELERYYQRGQAETLMRAGVTLMDPGRFDLRGNLHAGTDISIDVNTVLIGNIVLGDGVQVGANCFIRNAEIAAGTILEPNCVIDNAIIGAGCRIGPFARIRPDTRLDDNVHVGNFVEIKKSTIAAGSKVNHLSYIGDSEIGRDVNIGAGTITCNYDGANKFKTIIEDNVFIGSDTQLVAPVRVATGATIGAGTTVTRDVEANSLAVSRTEQRSVKNWQRPKKSK
ncbi:MAG: bifunctional UDP-N-acetylglucosamine diphosphorylase/glucosamine-1-phosphate N-acetyltransferase GlmU, partial [Gammaproteobacteria bacterium]